MSFLFRSVHTFWCAPPGFARRQSPISSGGLDWVVLERSTPSLSYMNCPVLVPCVPTPLANPCFSKNNCLPFFVRQFSVRPPTHPRVCLVGWGEEGLRVPVWCVPVVGSVAPTRAFVSLPREQSLGGSRGFRRLHRQKRPLTPT